jgi:hypothetical protein
MGDGVGCHEGDQAANCTDQQRDPDKGFGAKPNGLYKGQPLFLVTFVEQNGQWTDMHQRAGNRGRLVCACYRPASRLCDQLDALKSAHRDFLNKLFVNL